ncbi:unnamed protein product [Owenia fusiformis]|uniref:Uncharacterized protein n=1 Tax=Owenia fusiformis TaxID=6347 RepID=A0A8J1XX39_OWEFU|nr:unnamed protein product [Owenia fusiformis]
MIYTRVGLPQNFRHCSRCMSSLHRPRSIVTLSQIHLRTSQNILDTKPQYQQAQWMQQRTKSTNSDFCWNYFSTEWGPVHYAHELLLYVHTTTGLPWWASIALTTFGLRTLVTVPLQAQSISVMAKISIIQPEIKKIADRLKYEVAKATKQYGWSKKKARREYVIHIKKEIKKLYIRDNCHPMKATLIVFFQIPLWISLSFALRNMSGLIPFTMTPSPALEMSLATEGLLWFPSLLACDTTLLLPVLLGVVNLAIVEMHTLRPASQKSSKMDRAATWFLRGVSVLLVPIAATMPSCMAWYWLCSSSFGLAQNLLLKSPTFKRAIGVPLIPNESLTPYRDMALAARQRVESIKNRLGQSNQ